MEPLNVVDLFAGLKGWSQAFAERGHNVWTTDLDPRFDTDLTADIRNVKASDVPFDHVDVLLASPPCEGFSVAAIGKNWEGGRLVRVAPGVDGPALKPKSDTARLGIELVEATVRLITDLQPQVAVIENPRGVLRKLDLFPFGWERVTVWYCHYGEDRAKPTDLWGAPFPREWRPQPPCKTDAYGCGPALGDMSKRCHTAAPRGARTGTQGLDRSSTRAKVPYALSLEMCKAAEVSLERKVVA